MSSCRIILFHGNDEFEVERASGKFLAEHCPNALEDGSLTTVRGDVDTVDEAVECIRQTLTAVNSLNMFRAENITWLRNVRFLSGTLFKSQTVKESVEKLQESLAGGLGPEQVLLITAEGKLDARSRFLKVMAPVAEIEEFSKKTKEWEIKEDALLRLGEECGRRGLTAEKGAMEELAVRVGNDSRLMENELEKLELYAGDSGTLTLEGVERLVPMQQEAQVYLLGDCVGSRDLSRAMKLLGQMETAGLSPVGVMATLHNSLREMAYLGACVHSGDARVEDRGRFGKFTFTRMEAEQGFLLIAGGKKRSPFRIYQLGRQAVKFSPRELDRMLRYSAETYDAFFRSAIPHFEQLRLLILRIFYECVRKSA